MSHEQTPASQNKTGAHEPAELISGNDLFQYLELAGKVITAYLQFKTLPSGQEMDSPPIRYHHDTLTLHVKRD